MIRRAILAALAVASCGTTHPVNECGDQPCPAGYTAALDTVSAGTYVVELTFSGVTASITCMLAPGASGGCTTSDARVLGTHDAAGIVVEITGSPRTVGLRVTRDGQEILVKTSTPAYAPTYPNGDKCSPLCAVVEETYTLPG